ncbi:hypothetical protein [Bacillus solitudinis]|uniref:hypothetical protein n=1 Tax=Bacillus solitudinis TaxID=2014074 RepID=UPI000C23F20E|nr:hypothetical protein [Bacillus solitudinis]
MWSIMMMLLFVFAIGMTVGGLLAAPRMAPRPFSLIIFSVCFLFLTYIGMLLGMFISGWFAFRLMEMGLAIIALIIIVAAFTRFHPTLGFFHPDDKLLLALIACLFFFMGMEWGILEWRAFFTLFAGTFFFISIFLGLYIQLQIRRIMWRHAQIAYIPLIWLLFVSILKLL